MNWLMFHVGSGLMFFTSIGLLFLGTVFCNGSKKLLVRAGVLLFIIGLIAMAIAATPVSIWLAAMTCLAFLVWVAAAISTNAKLKSITCGVFLLCLALIVKRELPYHFAPGIRTAADRTLAVIGDSVTAGTGTSDKAIKWPEQIAEKHNIRVDNRSQPGEKSSTALKHIQKDPPNSSVVLVEIGGNDLMGSTTAEKFEIDLDALLTFICQEERQVIMLELPLPPFRNQMGAIQRRLARKHGVKLVPKRVFISVLTTENSTIDSVHLTQKGHDLFAEAMWKVLKPAYE